MDKFELFLPGVVPPVSQVLLEYVQIVLVPLRAGLHQYLLQSFQLDMNPFFFDVETLYIFKPDIHYDLLHEGIAIGV